MLHLLGLILKAFATIAIGIMGFTWEPKQDTKVPSQKDKSDELILPVYLNVPADMALVFDASLSNQTSCSTRTDHIQAPRAAPRIPEYMSDMSADI